MKLSGTLMVEFATKEKGLWKVDEETAIPDWILTIFALTSVAEEFEKFVMFTLTSSEVFLLSS